MINPYHNHPTDQRGGSRDDWLKLPAIGEKITLASWVHVAVWGKEPMALTIKRHPNNKRLVMLGNPISSFQWPPTRSPYFEKDRILQWIRWERFYRAYPLNPEN